MKSSFAQIAAQAVVDAGAGVVTHVPGFGVTQIFDAIRKIGGIRHPISFHEETAYTLAHGAALAGRRAAVLIKTHGLAKAANSVTDSLSAGTTAGLVVLAAEDKFGRHSDNILAFATLARGLGIPFERPPIQDIQRAIFDAFRRSEALQLPVAIAVDVDDLAGEGVYMPGAPLPPSPSYRRDIARHLLCPFLADYQQQVLKAKLAGADWQTLQPPELPKVPDDLPQQWQTMMKPYLPLFGSFHRLREAGEIGDIVAGDVGVGSLFAFPPFDGIDLCTYMGGSLPLAIGALLGGRQRAWAITGDFAFIAAGQLGLLEAVQRGLALKVLILNNGCSATTGGQPIPQGMLERMLQAYAPSVRFIADPEDAGNVEAVLREAAQAMELRIVVAKYCQNKP